jgi:hypothetical protein
METLHRSIFLKELKNTFPQLTDEINAQYGLLHLEMHIFADFAQRCIAGRDMEKVRLSFMVAEKYWASGNADMRNAIDVSFVEHLDLRKAQWAWDLLGPNLKDAYLHCVEIGAATPLPYLSHRSHES